MPPGALTVDEKACACRRCASTPTPRLASSPHPRTGDEQRRSRRAAGANRVGARRFATLVGALGLTALDQLHEVLDYGERRMRAALTPCPTASGATDVLDSAGPRPDQQSPTPVVVTLRVHGDEVTFDFTGTGAQRPGTVNAPEAVTVSAVGFALRCATDPTIPANGGALRPVHVVAPAGTVVAAQPPVAVGAGNVEVSQRVADVCLAALELARPGCVGGANQGTMNNVLLGADGTGTGSTGTDGAFVYYETIGGGQGARPWADGMSGVHTVMTNTRDTPVEALERELPVRVVRYTLRRGSGGGGEHRGGDGIERDLEVLVDTTVSLVTERRSSRPPGTGAGAEPGAAGENWLLPGGDERAARPLPDKCTVELRAGDVLRVRTPGGGGWSRRASG
ncbi:MAG: hydantoinase B/oxoprolinase family protein [Acidimicrobiia bacterium]